MERVPFRSRGSSEPRKRTASMDDFSAPTATGGNKKKSGGFQSLGLSPNILGGILKMGYKVPTPIQRKTLPIALSGRDLVAMARTGPFVSAVLLFRPRCLVFQ